jgi:hypothetical protein
MREHDVDVEGPGGAPSHREQQEMPSGREVGHGIEAGRPDTLGHNALLHLQRSAGNSGVASLIAQRSAEHDGHDHDGDGGHDEGHSPVNDVVSGGGRPLDTGLRASMEQSMGHDFGDVRVHDDAQAAASAKSVQAHAYTVGNHVVFNEGRYQPDSTEGRKTLAHELTHVVQQREGPVDGTPAAGGIKVSDPSDRFEREAESNAERVVGGSATDPAPAAAPAPAVQRHADESAEAPPVQRQAAEEEEVPAEAGAEAAPPSEAPAEHAEEEEAAG